MPKFVHPTHMHTRNYGKHLFFSSLITYTMYIITSTPNSYSWKRDVLWVCRTGPNVKKINWKTLCICKRWKRRRIHTRIQTHIFTIIHCEHLYQFCSFFPFTINNLFLLYILRLPPSQPSSSSTHLNLLYYSNEGELTSPHTHAHMHMRMCVWGWGHTTYSNTFLE